MNPNLEISALCDLNQEQLDHLRLQYKPDYVTTDMKRVFEDRRIGMVICGTKPDFRLPIMKMAVRYGKPLFVEKPLCVQDQDILPMLELLRDNPIPFMVGFNRPYSRMMQEVRKLYRQYKQGSATIIYRIIGEARLWPKHHYDAVVHGGESTIIHEVTHIFDLINWLTGLAPTRVYTAGEGNLDNVITLTYPDHVTAVIIAGDNSNAGFPKERLEINTGYTTIIGNHFTELIAICGDGQLIRKTFPYTVAKQTFETDGARVMLKSVAWRNAVTDEEIRRGYYYDKQVKVGKGHAEELEYFRQVIEAGQQPETNIIKAAIAQLTASKAIESYHCKQALDLAFPELWDREPLKNLLQSQRSSDVPPSQASRTGRAEHVELG